MRRMWNKNQLGGELTPDKLSEVLEGSESVVVDENEEGDKLQVRLDNDYKTKIDKALVTPTSAPTEKVLVGVGIGREQIQVNVGEGLSLEGDTSPYTLNDGRKKINTTIIETDSIMLGGIEDIKIDFSRPVLIRNITKQWKGAILLNYTDYSSPYFWGSLFGESMVNWSNITPSITLGDHTSICISNETFELEIGDVVEVYYYEWFKDFSFFIDS